MPAKSVNFSGTESNTFESIQIDIYSLYFICNFDVTSCNFYIVSKNWLHRQTREYGWINLLSCIFQDNSALAPESDVSYHNFAEGIAKTSSQKEGEQSVSARIIFLMQKIFQNPCITLLEIAKFIEITLIIVAIP